MARVEVKVSVDDAHLDRLPEVVERLRAAGMQVDQALGAIGVVTGSVEADQLRHLSQVDGALSIESSRDFQIGPPDAPVQ
jgi:hypothetical protein